MSLTVLAQCHRDECYIYHSDLSYYVSDCSGTISQRWVLHLSQWFIVLCLWMFCHNITEMSVTSITVIYRTMSDCSGTISEMSATSITLIYRTKSDCSVTLSQRWVLRLSQWFIVLCLTVLSQYHSDLLYHVSDCSVTISVIYRTIALTVLSQYHSAVLYYVSDCSVTISQWFIVLCLTVLSQYQWFIVLCLWLFCHNITVIYRTMSLTVL
jgi:hypothetical protein